MRIVSDILAVIAAYIFAVLTVGALWAVLFLIGVLDAVVIADVWRWFAVPFLGVKQLSVGAAFGLNLVVWAFIRRTSDVWPTSKEKSKTPGKDAAVAAAKLLASILLGWGIGYLVARFWTHTL